MKILETVPMSALGPVHAPETMEEFAGFFVRNNSTLPEQSMTVTQIERLTDMSRRSIYNRLRRPGFVKIQSGPHATASYYYLYSEGFGELAREQGTLYYPKHLGPLVRNGDIPAVIEFEFQSATPVAIKPEVTGTARTDEPDVKPLLVRAVGISDIHVLKGSLVEALPKIENMLKVPYDNEHDLDNTLVLLAGIRRWVDKFNEYDVEKQNFIRNGMVNDA